jgi:hypothetical protein
MTGLLDVSVTITIGYNRSDIELLLNDVCLVSNTSTIESSNIQSQRQSYVTTDGQSASLSWCQATIWGLRPDFHCCQTVAGLLMWGVLSGERTGLPFTIAADPRQRSHSWVRVPWDR